MHHTISYHLAHAPIPGLPPRPEWHSTRAVLSTAQAIQPAVAGDAPAR